MTETDDALLSLLDFDPEITCEAQKPEENPCPNEISWRFESGCCHKVWLICNYHADMIKHWYLVSNPMATVTCLHCRGDILVKDYFYLLERLG